MLQTDVDYELQETIYQLLQDHPDWRRYLEAMVVWEQANPVRGVVDTYSGWEWEQVHTRPPVIAALIDAGVVDLRNKSRTYRMYRLRSLEDTGAALSLDSMRSPEVAANVSVDVGSLFSLVVGHEKAKALLRYAVQADKPVHALLVGAVGTAKTLMLQDVGLLSGAQFYVGSTTTKAGLVGLLLQVRPRFLVIDEIDKMANADMTPLLNLMETGMVTRLQYGSRERVEVDTKVFAGANDVKRIPEPILSRFAKFDIPAYTPQEFVRVAQAVLVQREGQGPEMALHIASEVVRYSTDIRDAVRVARMARGDPHQVLEVIKCLFPGVNSRTVLPFRSRT